MPLSESPGNGLPFLDLYQRMVDHLPPAYSLVRVYLQRTLQKVMSLR